MAIGVNLVLALLVAGLFLTVATTADWSPAAALMVLATLAVLSFLAEVRLKRYAHGGFKDAGAFFNAGIVLGIVTLTVAGPIPALIVWWIPDAISRIVLRREPIVSPGHVATLTGYAGAVAVGHVLLAMTSSLDTPLAGLFVLYAVGLSMYTVNFVLTVVPFAPFYEGQRVRALVRSEYLAMLPGYLGVLAIGVTTALLIPTLGVIALAPLGIAILLPQFFLTEIVRERSAARLAPPEAAALYASAIADVLGFSRRGRRVVALAAGESVSAPPGDLRSLATEIASWIRELAASLRSDSDRETREARMIARRAGERFDGGDPPDIAALLSPAPQPSRILTVARAWAELTAAGTPQLSHSDALLLLAASSGTEFDPAVVAAAAQVVAEEEAFVRDPDFQPQLHRLPLPRPVRRGLAPALLRRLAAPA